MKKRIKRVTDGCCVFPIRAKRLQAAYDAAEKHNAYPHDVDAIIDAFLNAPGCEPLTIEWEDGLCEIMAQERTRLARQVVEYINWERERGETDLRTVRHILEHIIKNGLTFKEWLTEELGTPQPEPEDDDE